MENGKRAAAYIRVSTEEQTELSPDSQLQELQSYAKANGYQLLEKHLYVDEGISGKNTKKRMAFNRMIGAAKTKPKPFDAILLWKFSRFARNREDSIVYKSMLRKQLGIEVISISEQIGDDKMAVLIEAMIEAMDEYYSINLAEEVRRGMKEAVRRGKPVSAAPFGYLIRNGVFIKDTEKAPLVQKIFEDTLSGKTAHQIAVTLTSLGVRTRFGNPMQTRTISYILRNPVYIGKIRWHEKANPKSRYNNETDTLLISGQHQPIIDIELWNQVQEQLCKRESSTRKKRREVQNPSIGSFKGLLRCSNCGGSLVFSPHTNGYQCTNYTKGICATSHYISERRLWDALSPSLSRYFGGLCFTHYPNQNRTETALCELQAGVLRLQRSLTKAKQAYLSEIDTLEEYHNNKKQILPEIDLLQQKINTAKNTKNNPHQLELSFFDLLQPKIPTEVKNRILKQCIDKIIYHRSTDTLEVYYGNE